jgi:type IV pilus assembly protein PilP
MTVVTDKRTYMFDLVAGEASASAVYALKFSYPNEKKIEAPKQAAGSGIQPDLNRPREPLEGYPLENLRMVGTLAQNRAVYALIKTPDNNLFRVHKGNYLGQNFGLITTIDEASVQLKEIVQDGVGEWSERASTLQLQEEQEVAKK